MKTIDGFKHEWTFDLPWHMADIKDWFYMVNVGYIEPTVFLHVRILGVRSVWTFTQLSQPSALTDIALGAAEFYNRIKDYIENNEAFLEETRGNCAPLEEMIGNND